jgi:hypothetical protein
MGSPINTVRDLMMALSVCPDDAEVILVDENGEGIPVQGMLQFSATKDSPAQVWLLMDECGDFDESSIEWTEDGPPDDDEEESGTSCSTEKCEEEKKDVIKIRGKLRSA